MKPFLCCLMVVTVIHSCDAVHVTNNTAATNPMSPSLVSGRRPSEVFRSCICRNIQLTPVTFFPENRTFHELASDYWNTALTISRQPAVVAQPKNAQQVSQLVVCAKVAKLRFTVKGGGHSYEAMSLINNGLVLDLSKMDWMYLTKATAGNSSLSTPRLVVGAGARVGPIYAYLFKYGLMMEGATCPTVGVSGLTHGGGTGHSTRRLGLIADHVTSAQVVTTSGDILNISDSSYPDLFWAVRGGGANFAIVTQWEFKTVAYPDEVSYGSLEWGPTADNLAQLLKAFNLWEPWLLPEDIARLHVAMYHDKVMLEAYCWCPEQKLQATLASFPYKATGLPTPNRTFSTRWSFSTYMLSSSVTNCYGADKWSWENISTTESVTAAEQAWRAKNTRGVWPFKGGSAVFLDAIPGNLLEAFAGSIMPRIADPLSFTRAVIIAAGGVQRRKSDNWTGFGYRQMTQQLEVGTEARSESDERWVGEVLGTLMPASKGRRFWNHFECLKDPEGPWRAYFGDHAERLLALKAKYDPEAWINAMNCTALNR